jgi:hypothetical protein
MLRKERELTENVNSKRAYEIQEQVKSFVKYDSCVDEPFLKALIREIGEKDLTITHLATTKRRGHEGSYFMGNTSGSNWFHFTTKHPLSKGLYVGQKITT